MPLRDFLRHHWPTVTIAVTAVAIACAAVVMLRSMPPHRIVMATGPEGGTYYEVGERYRAALARENVDVQLAHVVVPQARNPRCWGSQPTWQKDFDWARRERNTSAGAKSY